MNLVDRLAANSEWNAETGCRIWKGAVSRDHGVIKVGGKANGVHRVAWELARGEIPKGLWVLHNCGVGRCFNVDHLRLGTREENAADRMGHGGYVGKPGGGLLAKERAPEVARASFVKPNRSHLDQAEVRRLLQYDPSTGDLTWNLRADRDRSWNHRHGHEVSGSVLKNGYRYVNMDGKLYTAHRLAWLYMVGEWPSGQVDHVNGVRDDNRWANLRLATQRQNSANQGLRTTNKSGVKGVSWDAKSKRWYAKITVSGKQINLGYFKALDEAAAARRAAELEHHGEFARAEEVN